jgi:hypothetical protein
VPRDELQQWARTVELATPVPWGEVESRILSEPGPTSEESEEWARFYPDRGPAARVLVGAARALVVLPVALPTMGAPVLGLGFVMADVFFDRSLPDDLGIVLQFIFGAALLVAVFPFYTWWESRRRGWENVGLSAVTGAASSASFLLLGTQEEPSSGAWSSASWMALAAAIVAVAGFVFFLVVAKPPPRMRLGERFRQVSPHERWVQARRSVVLEELRKRRLVGEADSAAMVRLPLDSWSQLETHPDGRVVRHL